VASRGIPLQVNRGANRNASRGGEAQYATGILYHEGTSVKFKKSGASTSLKMFLSTSIEMSPPWWWADTAGGRVASGFLTTHVYFWISKRRGNKD